jgi:hypothetical protein
MQNPWHVYRPFAIVAALSIPLTLTYGVTRAWRAHPKPALHSAASTPITSGRHLIAYVLLDSRCGACTHRTTEAAIERLRTSLDASYKPTFKQISVVGVALDTDLRAGTRYLERLNHSGHVFDQLSVGGAWMNELVSQRVWRDAAALPGVPQVLLLSRTVDASGYPRTVDLAHDSVLTRVFGRDEIAKWVNRGTPLAVAAVPASLPTRR